MYRRRYVQYVTRKATLVFIPWAGILFIISLLWSGRTRRIARVLAMLCIVASLTGFAPIWISEKLVPGNYTFLDDYVCLDNIDLRHPQGKIAAYAWRTFIDGERRMIAFDDGHIESIEDDRARVLFEQQGIPYPNPQESGQ